MARIICVGNRMSANDNAGPLVYDRLTENGSCSVEIVDGGLAGLDLMPLFEGQSHVVVVDSTLETTSPGGVSVLSGDSVRTRGSRHFGHGAGLAYLLNAVPVVCDDPPARVSVVAIETPASDDSIAAAAEVSLRLAESRTGVGGE